MNENLHDELARLLSGYWYTQTIYVAAKLSLAEHLKDGPRAAQDLAQATGTNPRALYRLLGRWQALASSPRSRAGLSLRPWPNVYSTLR